MNDLIDPLNSKSLFKQMILKLKERYQLEEIILEYVENILGQRIIRKPCRGSKEDGKDIVSIENNKTSEYCSYIVKQGKLFSNLKGKNGVLKSLEEAMYIPVDECTNSKRTAIVVYNNEDGSRECVNKFNKKKLEIQNDLGNLVSREIERWNIDGLVDKVFPYAKKLRKTQNLRFEIDRLYNKEEILDTFILEVKKGIILNVDDNKNDYINLIKINRVFIKTKPLFKLINDFSKIENKYGIRSQKNES